MSVVVEDKIESKCISGVYKIVNKINGKIYVGSTVDLEKRKREHFNDLKGNKHCNKHLQRAFNKYNKEDNFIFEILEYVEDLHSLVVREQYYMDLYKSYDAKYGYNICIKADSRLGVKHTEESKKKMSESNKGKYIGENNPYYGKRHSEEVRIKMSKSSQGKGQGIKNVKAKLTEEQILKIDNMLKDNKTIDEIADTFKVHRSTIQLIKTGKHWSHITGRNRDNVYVKPIKITTEDQVIEVKKWLYKNKHCDQQIADILNMGRSTISHIRRQKTWSHVTLSEEDKIFLESNPKEYFIEQKITEKQVIEIKKLLKENVLSQSKIGKMFGLSQTAISKIKLGKSWSHIILEDYLDENGNIKEVI